MSDFIDFIIKATGDKQLSDDFKTSLDKFKDPEELISWFSDNGHSISESEAEKMINNKDSIFKVKEATVNSSY